MKQGDDNGRFELVLHRASRQKERVVVTRAIDNHISL